MSKIYNSPEVTLENAWAEITTNDTSYLEGKILTIIDATFSDPQQRKAQKDVFRDILWDWYSRKIVTGNNESNKGK